MELKLPRQLELTSLLPKIHSISDLPNDQELVLDFSAVAFATPTGIAPLAALVDRELDHRRISFRQAPNCTPFEYLQRINFFRHFNVFGDEKFRRHSERGRFAPLHRICFDSPTEKIADNVTNLLMSDESCRIVRSQLHPCLYESINNIKDHACLGNMGGYTLAQSYRRGNHGDRRFVFATADCGQGIKASLQNNTRLGKLDTHEDALKLACQPGVTGAQGIKNEFGDPRNMGQGLSQIDRIVESTSGIFKLISGDSERTREAGKVTYTTNCMHWQGTIVVVVLYLLEIKRYVASLKEASTGEVHFGS